MENNREVDETSLMAPVLYTTTISIMVPKYFHECDISYLIHMMADMLGRLTTHNDLIPFSASTLTHFHSSEPPSISIYDYLRRIVEYTALENACLLLIIVYIDRVCISNPVFAISSLTVHRFLITAATVGSKMVCDSYCTNKHYARVGGIELLELNRLELDFVEMIQWELSCTGDILQRYYESLIAQCPIYWQERGLDERLQDIMDIGTT
ncbi:uncharacterized protein VTP21DRAFT_8375 [Calcarisporiella thermophila]|uniref:uncharacterized protein n=1 Tax=Calcarisporiella thermophila TaxID=911321 RepID=UPI0037448BF1